MATISACRSPPSAIVLLVLRLGDGILDPLLGAWSDRAASRKRLIALAMPVLAIGMVALFAPPVRGQAALLAWLSGALALVYVAFSLATINHGAWGAELSSDPGRAHAHHGRRARGWRSSAW